MAKKQSKRAIDAPRRIIGTFKVHGFRVQAIGEAVTIQFKDNEAMRNMGKMLSQARKDCVYFTTAPDDYTDEQMLAVRARARGE